MHSKTDIENQLKLFKEAQGSPVLVHSSLKSVGEIEEGGETLLKLLIDFFAKGNGLLCFPTHTWDKNVCDMRTNDSCTGVMSRLALSHPKALRSLHPTHSMAVFGEKKRVLRFIAPEEFVTTPVSPKGCYGNLYHDDGYILLIGVGQEKNTFIHCVEEMLDVPQRLTKEMVERTIIHKDLSVQKRLLYWFDETIGDVSTRFGKFESAFKYHGCITEGVIGNAPAKLCRARKIKEVIELIYKRNNYRELLDNDAPLCKSLYQ